MDSKYNFWLCIAIAILIVAVSIYLAWTFKDLATWDSEVPFT